MAGAKLRDELQGYEAHGDLTVPPDLRSPEGECPVLEGTLAPIGLRTHGPAVSNGRPSKINDSGALFVQGFGRKYYGSRPERLSAPPTRRCLRFALRCVARDFPDLCGRPAVGVRYFGRLVHLRGFFEGHLNVSLATCEPGYRTSCGQMMVSAMLVRHLHLLFFQRVCKRRLVVS